MNNHHHRTTVRQLLKNWVATPKYADKRAGNKIRYKSFTNKDPLKIRKILTDRLNRHGINATVQIGTNWKPVTYSNGGHWVAITI